MSPSSKRHKSSACEMPIAEILLESSNFAFDFFIEQFVKKWQIRISPCREEDRLGLIVDGRVIGCALVPTPLSDGSMTQEAKDNVLWPEAESCVMKHKARLQVAITREGEPVAAHVAFTKVLYNLLRDKSALGIYLRPGLFEPEYYIKCAESLTLRKLPTELWVHINQIGFEQDSGYSFFTTGMNKFGKNEFEIVDTKTNFIDAYYSLKELVKHTIENDVSYRDGDAVSAEGMDGKARASVSKGIRVKGTTVKISL